VGLERGPLSLLSTIEELLGRKRKRLRSRNPIIWPQGSVTLTTWYPQSSKVDTNFADKRVRSAGIVGSRTQATEFTIIIIIGGTLYCSALTTALLPAPNSIRVLLQIKDTAAQVCQAGMNAPAQYNTCVTIRLDVAQSSQSY
jgi:hypothetical protein